MSNWNNESEAREQIKALVAEYYNDFKKPEQIKSLHRETEFHMLHVCMMKKK